MTNLKWKMENEELLWQFLLLGLWQEEAQDQIGRVNQKRHPGRGVSELRRGRPGRRQRHQLCGQQRGRRAEHKHADVRGEALTRPAQMRRINARTVISPDTQLSDRDKT